MITNQSMKKKKSTANVLKPDSQLTKVLFTKNYNNIITSYSPKMNLTNSIIAFTCIFLTLTSSTVSSISILRNRSVSSKLEPLLWTSTNTQFRPTSNRNHLELTAQIGDNIDLVCPKEEPASPNSPNYLTIYKVGSKYEFDNCIINPNNRQTVPILRCDKPQSSVKFTLFFIKFSPVPFALEFEEDKEYYFLTTSSGDQKGLDYMTGGLCNKFNMKFSIKIAKSGKVEETSQILNNMAKITSTTSQKLQQDQSSGETSLPARMDSLISGGASVQMSYGFWASILSSLFVLIVCSL